jgi:hypothetical protein
MKSRICFYFAAIVALVLFVASLSAHATERRDPPILPDAQQAQSAKAHSSHAKASQKKPTARNAQKPKASSATAEKSSQQGANPPFESKDQSVSESSSGSGKSGRTSAGK